MSFPNVPLGYFPTGVGSGVPQPAVAFGAGDSSLLEDLIPVVEARVLPLLEAGSLRGERDGLRSRVRNSSSLSNAAWNSCNAERNMVRNLSTARFFLAEPLNDLHSQQRPSP